MSDPEETFDQNRYITDPENPDSDNDGINDGDEINGSGPEQYTSNPLKEDSDEDGVPDLEEIIAGEDGYITLPMDPHSDGDGLTDGDELDFDAVVSLRIAKRAGTPGPLGLYRARRRNQRDVSVAFLVDMSSSTNEHINTASKRIIESNGGQFETAMKMDSHILRGEGREGVAELDKLRARFGTLITVDRPATSGDFVELDLVATIEGAEIDRAEGVSYEVGSGELLEGIDEAIESLTAGEDTTFRSKLVGGDHAGEEAEVAVTVTSVKERELPEADDDFAQIASEFDTIAELRESLRTTASQQSGLQQTSAARDKLVDLLLEQVEIPVPAGLIEDEVHQHLEGEGRLEDDEHRAEVTEASEKQFRTQMILDKLTETYDVKVSQDELTQYLIQSAAQYGMSPQDFVNAIQQGNQLPAMVGEVARSKALVHALRDVKIVDTTGAAVDLSAHLILGEDEAEAEEEVVEEAQGIADAAADADEIIEAEEKPAPKKRAPRKSTKADAE